MHLGGTTSFKTLSAKDEDKVIYSISGQRLSAPHKGVNIINGKKLIVK
jgi:hypothetical protein